jgi:hypothetical protein
MKKLTKEEEWFLNNEVEFIRSLSDTFMELEYQTTSIRMNRIHYQLPMLGVNGLWIC